MQPFKPSVIISFWPCHRITKSLKKHNQTKQSFNPHPIHFFFFFFFSAQPLTKALRIAARAYRDSLIFLPPSIVPLISNYRRYSCFKLILPILPPSSSHYPCIPNQPINPPIYKPNPQSYPPDLNFRIIRIVEALLLSVYCANCYDEPFRR